MNETPLDAPINTLWGGTMPADEAIRQLTEVGFGPGAILHRFGDWCVTAGGIDCLAIEYQISWNELWSTDWPAHMARKNWASLPDFLAALEKARALPQAQRWRPAA